ncbi:MAG: hypothetical protein WBP93_21355 [Pyrinomonadaceae bacterium]
MSNRISSKKKPVKVGRNIVRAWFDTVINPLLNELKKEEQLLEDNNWTWRFLSNRLESIRPIQEMISYQAVDNLEQFTEFYPSIKVLIAKHDEQVSKLLSECEDLHRVLADSSPLLELYKELTSPESLAKLDKTGTGREITIQELFGSSPERTHLEFLAEYIANKTNPLPIYYNTSPLWNKHRDEFIALLNKPVIRDYYVRTVKAGETLLETVRELINSLKKIRSDLSLEHDLPYVSATTLYAEQS